MTLALGATTLFTACSTQVAVDSNIEPVATFRSGVFYGEAKGDYQTVFQAVNKSLDQLGYMRVGQIPERTAMTVIARGVGDVRVEVRLTRSIEKPGVINVRIAVGRGDLPACQHIFNKITSNL